MFTEEELEALVLGVRMVQSWGDSALAAQARSVLSKVENVLPERLRDRLDHVGLYAPGSHVPRQMLTNLQPLRSALTGGWKLQLAYTSAHGEDTGRVVRPLALYYWGSTWTLVAWCELREDFRTFRPDRMRDVRVLGEKIPDDPRAGLDVFLARMAENADG
jgi:predicted DNA-binding transcriptional regulator YafY